MKKLLIGGQAVMEGVMMKSQDYLAIAVRNEKGRIVTKKEKLKKKKKFLQLPFIRGIVNLVETLVIGIRSLVWSANQLTEEKEEFSKLELIATLAISIGFVILFFVALPYFLTVLTGAKEETSPVFFNLIDGIIKIVLFLLYLLLISLMKDIKILFQYHGAEHKAVNCYEAEKKLTSKNAKKFSTLHPRCGTSFLMLVLIISILIFSILPVLVINTYPGFLNLGLIMQKSILFPLRLLVIPIIAGLAYEALKLSARFDKNILIKIIIRPGLLLQKITTRKPTDRQLEVALTALKGILKEEKTKSI